MYGIRISSLGNEPEFVGMYKGKNKKEAADKAQNDPANKGLYLSGKFFATFK